MRAWIFVALATCVARPASAQDVGDTVWLVDDTDTLRFLGSDVAGPGFGGGMAVTVVAREGDHLRVGQGTRFGWVPISAVTTTRPAKVDPERLVPRPSDEEG